MKSDDLFLQEKWSPEQEEKVISEADKVILAESVEKLEGVSQILDTIATIFQNTRDWNFSNHVDRTSYDVADIVSQLEEFKTN